MAIDLITGHQGVSHISADQIATINNAMMDNFGANKVMRLVGGELTADGLTITISEGYWRVNGFDMEIQEGETLYIDPTTIGLSRIDDIYVEILQDIPTGAQRAEIYIALGEPSATPTAPDEPTAPYLNTDILLQIIKLARVTVSEGAMIMEDYSVAYNIVTPEDLNTVDVKASSALSSATNALGMIQDDSDAYSSSKSYKVGNYVVHEDKIYKCITACSAAAWSVNQNCFEETTLTTAVTELNSELNYSTSETVCGKWIDGSPIYRIVKSTIGVADVDMSSYNIKLLTHVRCIAEQTDGAMTGFPYAAISTATYNNFVLTGYMTPSHVWKPQVGATMTTNLSNSTVYTVFEYTKN